MCCRTLWIEITRRDIKREPKLQQYADETDRRWWLLPTPCPLLTEEGLCSIYEKRPAECRDFEADVDERCWMKKAREWGVFNPVEKQKKCNLNNLFAP